MKRLLIMIIVALSFATYGQNDCSIIDSVTIYTDTSYVSEQEILVGYLRNAAGAVMRPVIDTNEWHYFVFTKAANNEGSIYIDGELFDNGTFETHSYIYSSFYIGASYYTSWSHFYKGWLDELRVSNVVRTGSEILSNYQNNAEMITDASTIGLWHFNETSGTSFINSVSGSGILYNGAEFANGKFGNSVYFDGINDRGDCNINIPEDNITIEFWFKLDGADSNNGIIVEAYGMYTTYVTLDYKENTPDYQWSTGETTSSITIDPSVDTLVWVSNGTCTDTMIFANSYQEIYDTTYISVIDTLIIDAELTGVNPPNNVNTIKIYPNPAKTHIYINNGDYNLMNGYTVRISNTLGEIVYSSLIDQQEFYINLSDWSGNGIYFVYIIDDNSEILEVKKIIIQ